MEEMTQYVCVVVFFVFLFTCAGLLLLLLLVHVTKVGGFEE
jgi:hypothetical protein